MSYQEQQIAKKLGVTPTGLRLLARAHARGDAFGEGLGHGAASTRAKLVRDGLIEPFKAYCRQELTDEGRRVLEMARRMGW